MQIYKQDKGQIHSNQKYLNIYILIFTKMPKNINYLR